MGWRSKRSPLGVRRRFVTVTVDPNVGLAAYQVREIGFSLGFDMDRIAKLDPFLHALMRLFVEKDASLVEINPLVVTKSGDLIALDAKLNFDDNALYRHPEVAKLRDPDEEDAREREAREIDLAYVGLDGNIGCMVNGAGLAMATLDVISVCGGNPANFLDAGGGADKDKVRDAFKLILRDPKVKAILVNIFGGIVRCDLIAEGVVAAASELGLEVPLVVRLQGNSASEGRAILARSGLNITPVETLARGGRGSRGGSRRPGEVAMSILCDKSTKLLVQGLGRMGRLHAKLSIEYGTRVVARRRARQGRAGDRRHSRLRHRARSGEGHRGECVGDLRSAARSGGRGARSRGSGARPWRPASPREFPRSTCCAPSARSRVLRCD